MVSFVDYVRNKIGRFVKEDKLVIKDENETKYEEEEQEDYEECFVIKDENETIEEETVVDRDPGGEHDDNNKMIINYCHLVIQLLHLNGLGIHDINISIAAAANNSVVRRRRKKKGNKKKKIYLIKNTKAKKPKNEDETNQEITPWKVSSKGNIDYNKLIDQFGCQRIDTSLVHRIQTLTNRPAHIFLRRNIFFAHRDLNLILDAYERGEKFFLFTGRGPSSEALHLVHLVPFMFAKYLQDAFKVPIVIQLTDDEKFMWKDLTIEETDNLACQNARDIIACGFDISRTFIFQNFNCLGG